jgi:transcriptional regulator with XRE-family HTH domain
MVLLLAFVILLLSYDVNLKIMKQTPEDRIFAKEFGKELRPVYADRVKGPEADLTAKEFADALGVTVGGLQKYLEGSSMPSVLTLLRAYDRFGISVPYEGRHLQRAIKKSSEPREIQLMLPLRVETSGRPIDVQIVEVAKKSPASVHIQLRMRHG